MAYSKTPSMSTYSSERINFLVDFQHRVDQENVIFNLFSRGSELINAIVEVVPNPDGSNTKTYIRSRPALNTNQFYDSVPIGNARGLYNWISTTGVSTVISVVDNKVYRGTTTIATLTTSTGRVGFAEHTNDVGVTTLIMVDGTKGYTFATPASAPVLITDANFPSPHVPDPIFLDGYIFLAKTGTQDIYNSELNIPSSWSEGGTGGPMYISAEMYSDAVVALAKNNNYLYAVGSNSIEYFFDTANSTGSPLERYPSAVQQFGTPAPGSVVQTESSVIMIGDSGNGDYSIWTIDGFKSSEIATPAIKSIITKSFLGLTVSNAQADCIRVAGQKLYLLNVSLGTLVYSFETRLWSIWRDFNGINLVGNLDGAVVGQMSNGKGLCSMNSDWGLYDGPQASGGAKTSFSISVQTNKIDFGSLNRKFMSRLAILGDVPGFGGDTFNTFELQYSDDDYQSWSASRYINIGADFPGISQLGNFRRRAFNISYTAPDGGTNGPNSIRLEGIEVDINKGSQ